MTVSLVQDLRWHGPPNRLPREEPLADAPVVETPAEIGQLYIAFAGRLARIVRFNVRADEVVIEDACQFAWARLLHHRGRVRRDAVRAWLTRTATRQALKLVRRDDRELSLELMLEPVHAPDRDGLSITLEELIEQRGRLDSIGDLPRRQQRLVWLHGLGFSYAEMARDCGDSPRTVERQLLRGKRRLRSV